MDESFFRKYLETINNQNSNKEEIILYIKEKTGIELDESMFTLTKKEIKLNLSSVIKHKLFQKNIESLLKEKGYILKK